MKASHFLPLSIFIFAVHFPAAAAPPDEKPPGARIEEIKTIPASIVQIPTAIPAFMGITATQPGGPATFRKVRSLSDYENAFGRDAGQNAYLYASMKLFYTNGGGDAYVYSVGTRPSDLTRDAFVAALKGLEKEKDPTLIVFPDAVNLSPDDLGAVQQAALAHCAQVGFRFCILDVASADGLSKVDDPQSGFRAKIGTDNLSYGAAYGPWLKVEPAQGSGTSPTAVPASGAIAGIYAAVDARRGVWKAPANVALTGAVGLTETIDDRGQEPLNVTPSGKSINTIRIFPGKGTLVWGARTLAGNDNEWQYVPVRRLFLTVEESIRRSTAFVTFEPNDANTWIKVKAMIENHLGGLWKRGALAGAKPEAAFFVNVGFGSTMTADDISAGRLIINVGMAPVRPAEFIIIRLALKTQQD